MENSKKNKKQLLVELDRMKKRVAELESLDERGRQEQQISELRAELWKLAADENIKSEKELVNKLFSLVGECISPSRICINNFDKKKNTINNKDFEWVKEGQKPTPKNSKVPFEIWNPILTKDCVVVTSDSIFKRIEEYYPLARIPIVKIFIRKFINRDNVKSILLFKYKVNGVFEGFISFDECEIENREWTRSEKDIGRDMVKILSAYIAKMRTEKALNESLKRFKDLSDLLPMIVFDLDVNGNQIYINDFAEKSFGYCIENTSNSVVNMIVPKERTKAINNIKRVLNGETIKGEEYNLIKNNGSIMTSVIYSIPIYRNEKIIGIRGFGIDVTERKKIIEELKKAKESAEKADIAKSKFLAHMSHEIRTPMNVIMGFTDILNEEEEEPSRLDKFKIIKKFSNHLLAILNDVLDLSKIEAGKFEIEHVDFSIAEILNTIYNLFSIKAEDQNIEYKVHISKRLPDYLCGDPIRIKQILINLLGNSFKFTKKGHIIVDSDYKNGFLHLIVKDTGVGIKKEEQDLIFSAFEQSGYSYSSEVNGSGLGLAITKKLITLMDGEISLKSSFGKGSVFKVKIPLLKVKLPNSIKNKSNNFSIIDNEYEFDNSAEKMGKKSHTQFFDQRALKLTLKDLGLKLNRLETAIDNYNIDDIRYNINSIYATSTFADFDVIEKFTKVIENEILKEDFTKETLNILFKKLKDEYIKVLDDFKHRYQYDISSKLVNRDMKILVAEDIDINRDLMKMIFHKLGYDCDVAENGKIALDMLKEKKYDLLFLDMHMPVMDGLATLNVIKKEKNFNNLKIVALTANAMQGDMEKYIKKGCHGYVSKPVGIDELKEVITNINN